MRERKYQQHFSTQNEKQKILQAHYKYSKTLNITRVELVTLASLVQCSTIRAWNVKRSHIK